MTLHTDPQATINPRALRELAESAVTAAFEGHWAAAVEQNNELLKHATALKVSERVEAHNRLGRAKWQLGDLAGARAEFEQAKELDPDNRIAERNIARLKRLKSKVSLPDISAQKPANPRGLLQDAGSTAFHEVEIDGADQKSNASMDAYERRIAHLKPGDALDMAIREGKAGKFLELSAAGVVVGKVHESVASRLIPLMEKGNRYDVAVVSIISWHRSKKTDLLIAPQITIVLSETYRSEENQDRTAFPTALRTSDPHFTDEESDSEDHDSGVDAAAVPAPAEEGDDEQGEDAPLAQTPPETTADDAFLPEREEQSTEE